jgi:hypothetical protein
MFSRGERAGEPIESIFIKCSGIYFFNTKPGAIADKIGRAAIKAGKAGQIKQAGDAINGALAADAAIYFSCKEPLTGVAIEKALQKNSVEVNSKLKLYMISEEACSEELKESLEKSGIQKRN